jgi:hypothetical protein
MAKTNMYKVIHNDKDFDEKEVKVNLFNLSISISPNCEIFEINNGEIYLGSIQKKTIAYLSLEFCDSFCKKELPDSYREVEDYTSLLRRYVCDYNIGPGKSNLDVSFPTECEHLIKFGSFFGYLIKMYKGGFKDLSLYVAISFSLYKAARDKLVVNENMRQGEIIINFMKSDKHLFI